MPHYIKAERGLNHSIIYTDDTGRYFRFSDGTWAWRNHKGKYGIHDFHIKKKGWVTKKECMNLVKLGKLDLVICNLHEGDQYLRARVGSSVNGSLEKLVIKDSNEEKINAL